MWNSDSGCTNNIGSVWASDINDGPSTRVIKKIDNSGSELKRWSKRHFGNVRRELEKLQAELKTAEREAIPTGVNFRVQDIKKEITELLDKETRMWLQRSKTYWATHGDRNSIYFHSKSHPEEKRI